jgi:hypothetical protein
LILILSLRGSYGSLKVGLQKQSYFVYEVHDHTIVTLF